MRSVLVVEDSNFFSSLIRESVESNLDVKVTVAKSYAEAETCLSGDDRFVLALLDLNLPDAADGEIVKLANAHALPSVVFSGSLDTDQREALSKLGVIDSILKESPASLEYAVSLMGRLIRNRELAVMVVEDSGPTRTHIVNQLKTQQLTVFEAADGSEALATLERNPGIRLILTDYTMPEMDGFELIKVLRKDHSKEELAIVGMSSAAESDISSKFIKYGANDFIYKPFTNEELLCRISQNLDMIELMQTLKRSATVDFLTDLYNRRYLFDIGDKLFANAVRQETDMTVAMLDIDFFKKVNDTHGHDAGDVVLKQVSGALKGELRDADIVARLGGEEFCVAALDMNPAKASDVFERLRAAVEDMKIDVEGNIIPVTISIGIANQKTDSLEAMINDADEALYQAKEGGRNRVVLAA